MFLLKLLRFIDIIWFYFSSLFWKEKAVDGQVALVTGAAQGIGRALCEQLLKRGAIVLAVDVNRQQLDSTVSELKLLGKIHGFPCDISKFSEVTKLVAQISEGFGDIDLLFNNAGVIYAKRMIDMEPAEVERTISVNLLAHFWTIKNILPQMKKRDKGMIVNTSSMAGIGGSPLLSAYCASKFGVIGHSEALRNELRLEKSSISVHVAMPFMIKSAMNDTYFPPALNRNEALSNVISTEECASIIVGEALRGRFKIFVPHSSALTAFLTQFMPTWVNDILFAQSGFATLDAR